MYVCRSITITIGIMWGGVDGSPILLNIKNLPPITTLGLFVRELYCFILHYILNCHLVSEYWEGCVPPNVEMKPTPLSITADSKKIHGNSWLYQSTKCWHLLVKKRKKKIHVKYVVCDATKRQVQSFSFLRPCLTFPIKTDSGKKAKLLETHPAPSQYTDTALSVAVSHKNTKDFETKERSVHQYHALKGCQLVVKTKYI